MINSPIYGPFVVYNRLQCKDPFTLLIVLRENGCYSCKPNLRKIHTHQIAMVIREQKKCYKRVLRISNRLREVIKKIVIKCKRDLSKDKSVFV